VTMDALLCPRAACRAHHNSHDVHLLLDRNAVVRHARTIGRAVAGRDRLVHNASTGPRLIRGGVI